MDDAPRIREAKTERADALPPPDSAPPAWPTEDAHEFERLLHAPPALEPWPFEDDEEQAMPDTICRTREPDLNWLLHPGPLGQWIDRQLGRP